MKSIEHGYLYILRDPLNNNLIKIGYSISPFDRVKQLYNTSTALPYHVAYIWWVDDMRLAEKGAHALLSGHRVNSRREFFEIAPSSDFDIYEQNCYDTTSCFLETLVEIIEDGLNELEIFFYAVDIHQLYENYIETQRLFPEGVKGF